MLGVKGAQLNLDNSENAWVHSVKVCMLRCTHYLPWTRKCLIQGIIAKLMLNKRAINSVLYLGLAKEGYQLKAHAWVISHGVIVSGAKGYAQFSPVEWFI